MKSLLITGANRGLGVRLAERLSSSDRSLYCTGRDASELKRALEARDVRAKGLYEVDFANRDAVWNLYSSLVPIGIDAIVHAASPFSGKLKAASVAEVEGWSNFHLSASVLAKLLIDQGASSKVLILIGSVSGTLSKTSYEYPLYSAYKGYLRLLAETARHEGIRSHYINLGGFRDNADGSKYLSSNSVVEKIISALFCETDPGVQIDVMTRDEKQMYIRPE